MVLNVVTMFIDDERENLVVVVKEPTRPWRDYLLIPVEDIIKELKRAGVKIE